MAESYVARIDFQLLFEADSNIRKVTCKSDVDQSRWPCLAGLIVRLAQVVIISTITDPFQCNLLR